MATVTDKARVSDWLKWEEDNYYSRETVTVVSGAGNLATGTVLGKITASGKYSPSPATGATGVEVGVAVLVTPVDATSADKTAVVVVRSAIVSHAGLVYQSTVNDAAKRATKNAELAAVGILVREGA